MVLGALALLAIAMLAGLWVRAGRRAQAAEANELEAHRHYGKLHETFKQAVAAEAQRRSDTAKAVLLEAVTHNLRAPLTSIKASVTALIGEPTSPGLPIGARLELLQVLDEETDRLDRFVDALAALARIEGGALALDRRPSSIEDIMQAAVARARPQLGNREVEVAAQSDLRPIRVDAWALEEAIYQLLENATNHSPPRSVVRVSASVLRSATLEICVEDQGPGIADAERERIFERFFRGAAARAPGRPGLGLAIVKGVVDAHGGTVTADNRAHNAGARFTIHLPLAADEAAG
ncbi:MAG: hypothetical protein A3J29_09600 [Acidobacteria bacterium RIFCSPLOWO2_12_FULL_67_14b]|nr:MAG: hypothetical protein A3J29_09600 [Acidobacteria bacterium RIFCSPLOWO2_12_FULL_67_14b]